MIKHHSQKVQCYVMVSTHSFVCLHIDFFIHNTIKVYLKYTLFTFSY